MPNIKTFCRIKPTNETYEEHEATQDTLRLRVPEILKDFTNIYKGSRSYISHEFNFDHVFPQSTSQGEIFDVAASEIVNAFLEGYNGTIFAYGQTGTGKTYTMEGNAKTYDSRGIEPRALSMIYKELEKRNEEDLSIHLSYIEIYQDIGYDLLNPGLRLQSYVTPFPKVSVLEGYNGMCIVKNLSNHLAASEDVAQSLLLQGQANRKVAATAIHDRSSRSHAVFTIQLTSKKLDSDTIVRSKLHLVDLAGSERVAKTGVHGQQLTEAKSINLSLHHLETVIVALQQESLARDRSNRIKTSSGNRKYTPVPRPSSAEGSRGPRHVPYRNSLLTMLLRDSLGGNCMTSMIATISLEISNLGESISTCRFAGRVACIANTVARNEQLDDKSLIRKLRKRIAELEAELACLRLSKEGGGDDGSMRLTEEDKMICSQVVKQYLSGKITDPVTAGITNPYKFRECLKILKRVVSQNGYGQERRRNSLSVTVPRHSPEPGDEADQVGELVKANDKFERRNYQKLKLDGQPDSRVSTADVNGHRDSRSSRPTTSSTNLAWSEPPSRMSRGPSGVGVREMSASTHHSSASAQQPSVTPSPEKIWFTSTKRDPDTLSELLENDTVVKTPFEQKRITEIKKLNNKVEKMSAEKVEKEQQALELKIQVAEKELDLMERHMKTKLGVTTAQVEDQHAYVKQLTSTEADPSLIEQEKLVEKQLRKRKDKYAKQLEYIEYRREQLKKQTDENAVPNDKQASIQEKFGQYRKRDGSLNTRQVFQMLKQEERKQIKAQNHFDREKIQATADLMEIKELATRQKLRELKEVMKNTPGLGTGTEQNRTDSGGYRNTNGKVPEHIAGSGKENNVNNSALTNGFNDPKGREKTFFVENGKNKTEQSGQLFDQDSFDQGNESNNTRKDKDLKTKWESNYSRPTTPSNLKIPDTDVKKANGAHKELKNSKDAENQEKSRDYKPTNQKGDAGVIGVRPEAGQEKSHKKLPNGLSEDMIESHSRKIEEELYKSKNNRFREKNKALYEKDSGQNVPTQMPSEYVYGMSNPEQFDARRMGLSAKNFDSALTSMLGQDNTGVYPKNEDYEQFARTSKYRPNPYIEAANQKLPHPRLKSRQSSRPPTRDTVNKPKPREGGSNDRKTKDGSGQDSASTVTNKLNQYLHQTSSKEKSNKGSHRSRPASQGTADGYNMDEFLRNNSFTMFNSSGPSLEIEEEHPGKVKAMQEQEREQTFMNRAQIERSRVNRIRLARQSAEIIQRSWRRYLARKKKFKR